MHIIFPQIKSWFQTNTCSKYSLSLWSNKVSMLTHTYPHNPWGRFTRLAPPFMCGLMSDMVICKFRKSMVIHDTECPYWDQVSLNSTNPTQPKYSLLNWSYKIIYSCQFNCWISLLPYFIPYFLKHLKLIILKAFIWGNTILNLGKNMHIHI